MAANGIIEPLDSPWAAKHGGWRPCVDFRRLNAFTRKDSYPLPRIDDALDYVAGSGWFSSLDLRRGYWQVELAPEACPKTAFTIGQGLWQFLLVHAQDFDQAVHNLREVLTAIRSAGLWLNPAKCNLLARKTRFLGHRNEREKRVVAYYSLSRPERKYCVTQRELLAVVLPVHYFRPYLLGTKFTLRTDHASLTWMLNFRQPEGQVARWLEILQDRQEERGLQPSSAAVELSDTGQDGELFTTGQLRQQQVADRVEERGWLESRRHPDWQAVSSEGPEIKMFHSQWGSLELHDGVLYRWWQAPGEGIDRLQLLVPKALLPQVLRWVHGAVGSGHFGTSKTVWRLRQCFYWPGCRLVEWFNHTLATQLAILTSQHQRDWDQHLPLVLWAYRTAVQESSQCTPATLMFGRELRTLVDLVFGSAPEPEIEGGPELEYFRRLKERLNMVHQLAREALENAGACQKRAYDARAHGPTFTPGDKVSVFCSQRKRGLSPKLTH
ncbi:hypothetical protein QQF64_005660 [Cirrhinus molitorella]|uniref:Gypsy retrotransposon integrase-like protein 1 n=1 Tax=Cirrhinus molitorella TaxID=172907 RepID=A0ABR3MF70_9TELE